MKLDITAIIKFSFELVMPEVGAYGKNSYCFILNFCNRSSGYFVFTFSFHSVLLIFL